MTGIHFEFGQPLVQWYDINKRDLPWRHTKDPYLIWLSEVILQQTRVAQGLPYYEKFAMNYPSVVDLAAASEQEVLRLWQGLGYYSRARNMHTTARIVAEQYNGQFPDTYNELLQLKGIGPYTAAAIASFAFNEPVAVVDGNVFRVLARVYGITEDIASHKGKQVFSLHAQQLLQASMPDVAPSIYNQAIMEFGATHCTPTSPACHSCIFSSNCYAHTHSMQQQLPVKEKKIKIRQRSFVYFIFEHKGELLVRERGSGDIWQGLYDFPMADEHDDSAMWPEIIREIYEQIVPLLPLQNLAAGTLAGSFPLQIKSISGKYKHQLTHQSLQVQFVRLAVLTAEFWQQVCCLSDVQPVSIDGLEALPKPILVANYLQERFF